MAAAEAARNRSRSAGEAGRSSTADFRTITRRLTPDRPPADAAEIAALALGLLEEFLPDEALRFRLLGVGISNFPDPDEDDPQGALFEA